MKKLLGILLVVAVLFTIPAMALAEDEAQPGPVGLIHFTGL